MIQQQVANPLFTFIQELHQHSHSVVFNKGFAFKLEEQQNYCGFEISKPGNPVCEVFGAYNYISSSRFIGVGQANELNNKTLFYYVERYQLQKPDAKSKETSITIFVNFDENAKVVSIEGHYYPSKRPVELNKEIINKLRQNYASYLSFMLYILQLKNVKVEKILTEILSLETNLNSLMRDIKDLSTCEECLQQANNINLLYKAIEKYTGYSFDKYANMAVINDKISELIDSIKSPHTTNPRSFDDLILDIERNIGRLKNISIDSHADFVNRLVLISNTSELVMSCIANGSYQTAQMNRYVENLNALEKEAHSQDSLFKFLINQFKCCDLNVIKKNNEYFLLEMITPTTMRKILAEIIKDPEIDVYKSISVFEYLKETSLIYKLTIFSLNYSFVPEMKISNIDSDNFGYQGIIGQSFLHYAVSFNNLALFDLLLKHGANPNTFGVLVSDDDQEEQFSSIYLINLIISDKSLEPKFLDILFANDVVVDVSLLNDYNLSLIERNNKTDDEEVKNIIVGSQYLRKIKTYKYALYTFIGFADLTNVIRMQELIKLSSLEGLLICLGKIINSTEVYAEEIINNRENGFSLFNHDAEAAGIKIAETIANFDISNNKLMLSKIVNCAQEIHFSMAEQIFQAINQHLEEGSYENKSNFLVKTYNSIYTQMNDVKHAETYLDYNEACIFILTYFKPLGYTYLFALFNLHLSAGEKILISKRESKMPQYMITKAILSYNKALEFYKILLKLFRTNMDDVGVDQKELHLRLDRFRMKINPFFNSSAKDI